MIYFDYYSPPSTLLFYSSPPGPSFPAVSHSTFLFDALLHLIKVVFMKGIINLSKCNFPEATSSLAALAAYCFGEGGASLATTLSMVEPWLAWSCAGSHCYCEFMSLVAMSCPCHVHSLSKFLK